MEFLEWNFFLKDIVPRLQPVMLESGIPAVCEEVPTPNSKLQN